MELGQQDSAEAQEELSDEPLEAVESVTNELTDAIEEDANTIIDICTPTKILPLWNSPSTNTSKQKPKCNGSVLQIMKSTLTISNSPREKLLEKVIWRCK